MRCRFEVVETTNDEYEVRFSVDEEPALTGPFKLDIFKSGRVRDLVSRLESGSCNNTELAELGTHLWSALQPGEIGERIHALDGAYSISLAVPDELEISRLPWEALFDDQRSVYLAWDARRPLSRCLTVNAPAAPPREGPLKILVAIPGGSQLDTMSELNRLRASAKRLGRERIQVEPLDGLVTSDRLRNEITKGYDVFHFIGHSRFNEVTGGVELRINSEYNADGEQWLDANQFAALLVESQVRLTVFNSCQSASATARQLSGLGRQLSRLAAVPAVIAMRYVIDDISSMRFSHTFYSALLSLASPGRVDLAVQNARGALYTNAPADAIRTFITPVLYLATGGEQLFAPDRIAKLHGPTLSPPAAAADIEIPLELLDRFRTRSCVPIIGAGLYRAATRDALPAIPPTLIHLVTQLATEANYANEAEIEIAQSSSEFATVLYPRIFQYFESKKKRYALVERLQACCAAEQPPDAMLRVGAWSVPGIVYTHFDGLMEEALRRGVGEKYRRFNAPNQSLGSSTDVTPQVANYPVLFNLRGTLTEADTLVLTESDHERLSDSLAQASKDVINLFKTIGRCVLFIGVSPLDPAVRRMARLFLETPLSRSTQGPRYFVMENPSDGDRAYWKTYEAEWINVDPWRFIDALEVRLKERSS